MRRVFVDTSAFFAHLVAEDAHHPDARALFERADRETWTLITTNAVVWETYTLIRIRARNGRELALGFLEDIQDGLCDIERVRPVDETRATSAWTDRFDGGHPGITHRRHSNRANDQTLEHRRFGQSSLSGKRLESQFELRIDSTLDAGTCGHVEHRLTSAALCLSCKTHELTSECCANSGGSRCRTRNKRAGGHLASRPIPGVRGAGMPRRKGVIRRQFDWRTGSYIGCSVPLLFVRDFHVYASCGACGNVWHVFQTSNHA